MVYPIPAAERKDLILAAAMRVAEKIGYHHMTRDQIAKEAGVSPGLITARLGTMAKMRTVVMREAIKGPNLRVLGQGLALMDKIAMKAPDELKRAAGKALSE